MRRAPAWFGVCVAALACAAWSGVARARWTAASVAPVADGLIYGSLVRGDSLVIYGGFRHLGGTRTGPVAVWDGARWSSYAHSDEWLPARVRYMATLPDGGCAAVGYGVGYQVYLRSGDRWTSLYGHFNREVNAVLQYRGALWATGTFTRFEGDSVAYLARWDGQRWRTPSVAVPDSIYSILGAIVFHDTLHVLAQLDNSRLTLFEFDGERWTTPASQPYIFGTESPPFIQLGDSLLLRAVRIDRLVRYRGGRWDRVNLPSTRDESFRIVTGDASHLFVVGHTLVEQTGATWTVRATASPESRIVSAEYLRGHVFVVDNDHVWELRDGGRTALIDGEGPEADVVDMASAGGILVCARDGGPPARFDGLRWTFDAGASLRHVYEHDGELWGLGNTQQAAGTWNGLFRFDGSAGAAALDATWRPWGAAIMPAPYSYPWFEALGWHEGSPVVALSDPNGLHIVTARGSTWVPMGEVPLGDVSAFATYRGTLFVTGSPHSGHDPAVFWWRDNAWHEVPGGPQGVGTALCVWHDMLAIGGAFVPANGDRATDLVVFWNGARWDSTLTVSHDIASYAALDAMAVYRDRLMLAGGFDSVDGTRLEGVARLDGQTLVPLAGGPGADVRAVAVMNDKLYAGLHAFGRSDENTNIGVRAWRGDDDGNPFALARPSIVSRGDAPAHLRFVTDLSMSRVRIVAYDVRGRRVAQVYDSTVFDGEHQLDWNPRDDAGNRLAPGIYVLELTIGRGVYHDRLLVVP